MMKMVIWFPKEILILQIMEGLRNIPILISMIIFLTLQEVSLLQHGPAKDPEIP